jgi:HEAT repeat protein
VTAPAGGESEVLLPPAQVEELLRTMVKALRATQIYLPNNPIYQRAVESVRAAFRPIWEVLSDLTFTITESDFLWDEQVVYHQTSRSESLAWTLYKDGLRLLTLRPGAEDDEMVRFIEVVNKVRALPSDAEDDLLTLLWEQDFQLIHYIFSEVLSDAPPPVAAGGPPIGFSGGGGPPPANAEDARARNREAVAEDAAEEARPGVVRLEDFDSTLYFLDDAEVAYIAQAVEKEYAQDLRGNVMAFLCDLFEIQTAEEVRDEILGILESFPAYLLASGDLRAVAEILRETKVLALRARTLDPRHRERLENFARLLSEPAAVNELLRALDEARVPPPEGDLQELFRELRGSALEPVMVWLPRAANATAKEMLTRVAAALAEANPAEVLRILGSPESEALESAIALAGRLRLQPAVPGLAQTLVHADAAIRLASAQALAEIGSPGAFSTLERAVGDADREVRLYAVRTLGARGQRGALKGVEAVVLGKGLDDRDLTERQAFFDAYALIAGAAAVGPLAEMLQASGGLFKRKVSGETRACAVVALAKIRHPDVPALLQKAAQDKDAVVRNAAGRAIREGGR